MAGDHETGVDARRKQYDPALMRADFRARWNRLNAAPPTAVMADQYVQGYARNLAREGYTEASLGAPQQQPEQAVVAGGDDMSGGVYDAFRDVVIATGVCDNVMDFEHGAFAEENGKLHLAIAQFMSALIASHARTDALQGLLIPGARLSNCVDNLAQRDRITPHDKEAILTRCNAWDAAYNSAMEDGT